MDHASIAPLVALGARRTLPGHGFPTPSWRAAAEIVGVAAVGSVPSYMAEMLGQAVGLHQWPWPAGRYQEPAPHRAAPIGAATGR